MNKNQIKKARHWRQWIEDEFVTIVTERKRPTDDDVVNFAAEIAYVLNLNAGLIFPIVIEATRSYDYVMTKFEDANKNVLPAELFTSLWSEAAAYAEDFAARYVIERVEKKIKVRRKGEDWDKFGTGGFNPWYLKD